MKLFLFLLLPLSGLAYEPLKLTLPTDNRAIFNGKPEDFYMWVPRHFDGKDSKP